MVNAAKALLGWLLSKLWQKREVIADAVEEHFDGSLDDPPRSRPWAQKDTRHVEKQIESATSFRVEDNVSASMSSAETKREPAPDCRHCKTYGPLCGVHGVVEVSDRPLGSPRQISSRPPAPKVPSMRVQVQGARPSSAPAPLKPPARIPRPAPMPGKPKGAA